jgi:acetylglutamate kinase
MEEKKTNNNNSVIDTIDNKLNSLLNSPLRKGHSKNTLYIIKIGGNIVDNENILKNFLKEFSNIFGSNSIHPFRERGIIIHGGGKIATKIGDKLGIESKYVNGRRITDDETLDVVTMVYAGLINKKITAQLQANGCNAMGLTGADGNSIQAHKRIVNEVDYGFAGDIDYVNAEYINSLLEISDALVFAPITHNKQGQLLNTNADTIAQEIAKAMSSFYNVNLIYSFEKAGVLLDVNDDATLIKELNIENYSVLKSNGKIFAGMIPKLDNAFEAVNSGVKKVIIGKAEDLLNLIEGNGGTHIS